MNSDKKPFIAIVLASNRPQHVAEFFDNLQQTADDQASFEVLIRADEGDDATINVILAKQKEAPFRIHLLVEKNRKGTFMLHEAYNRLIKEFASPSVYFFWNLTDEIRLRARGWDNIIKGYIKFYGDDLFRLKPTLNNIRNYYEFSECLPLPDNYSLFTRRWMELVGGWGDYWGTDTWHQCIDWYLGQCRISRVPHGVFRSIPVFTIAMDGQGSGEVMTGSQSEKRRAYMAKGSFAILSTLHARENFNRLAKRLYSHFVAKEHKLDEYIIQEDLQAKKTMVLTADCKVIDIFSWSIQFHSAKSWLVEKAFHVLGEKNGGVVVEFAKRIINTIRQIRHRSTGSLNAASGQLPFVNEYHFREGENKFFPSSDLQIAKLIEDL